MTFDERNQGAAFPVMLDNVAYGISKREYFAGQALVGILSNDRMTLNSSNASTTPEIVLARGAVAMADALIKALERKPDEY